MEFGEPRAMDPGRSQVAPDETAEVEQLRQILDVSTDFIFTKDTSSRYTYVNRSMAELFGCRPEDLEGKLPSDVFDSKYARLINEVDRIALSGEIADEVRVISIAGSEHCFHTVQVPLRDGKGAICGICGVVRDISVRREAEQKLRDQHGQLLSIFDGLDEVIYVADPETYELLYMNSHAINIWGDRIGETCYSALQDRDSPCPFCSNGLIFGEFLGRTHIWEFTNLRNDRTYRCLDKAITWSDDRPVRFELAIDITDLRMAEQRRIELERQVQHAQKLESLGVLAGGIAHDFNNILMAVLGNVDIALRDVSATSPVYGNLKEIESAARRAADLSRQMLAYSGRGQFLVENISINEVVTEITHILEVSISKKVTIKYRKAEDLPLIEADATQIRQVIMNLVTNASDAIGDREGVISIDTGAMICDEAALESRYIQEIPKAGLYVFLEVTDTGSGMDRETLDRLFDPFFTTKFTGRGLGLSAVLGIIRGHGGSISIRSKSGRGTSVRVLIPACTVSETSVHSGEVKEDWTGSGTVLLVDDEVSVRSVGRRMLELMGFNVLTARDGYEALEIYGSSESSIDLVILDMTMPHLDGVDTFRKLRDIDANVRVLISSGYSKQDVALKFRGGQPTGFLPKPYDAKRLEAVIREVWGNR